MIVLATNGLLSAAIPTSTDDSDGGAGHPDLDVGVKNKAKETEKKTEKTTAVRLYERLVNP